MSIIELKINVDNVAQIATLYDQLQVFKSPNQNGTPNPFIAITDSEAISASIDGTIAGPWNLNGQFLNVTIDSADPVVVSFPGPNPFSIDTVISALNSATSFAPDLASEIPTNSHKIRLTSPVTGTQSIIQLSGSAAATLGLSTLKVNGKGANPLLSPNTETYTVDDFDGDPTFWYKARYVKTSTGAVSSFSDPFLGGVGTGLPGTFLVTGSIALADPSGRPITGRRIIFVSSGSQVVNDGFGHNYGVLPSVDRIITTTDGNGRASISLVKGQRLKVFIEGTTFQREFVVPSSDFDVLTVASVQPDPLSIVTAAPLAIRVSE